MEEYYKTFVIEMDFLINIWKVFQLISLVFNSRTGKKSRSQAKKNEVER